MLIHAQSRPYRRRRGDNHYYIYTHLFYPMYTHHTHNHLEVVVVWVTYGRVLDNSNSNSSARAAAASQMSGSEETAVDRCVRVLRVSGVVK